MDDAIKQMFAACEKVKSAFGPPGDYGYYTPEGAALFALYRAYADLTSKVRER